MRYDTYYYITMYEQLVCTSFRFGFSAKNSMRKLNKNQKTKLHTTAIATRMIYFYVAFSI